MLVFALAEIIFDTRSEVLKWSELGGKADGGTYEEHFGTDGGKYKKIFTFFAACALPTVHRCMLLIPQHMLLTLLLMLLKSSQLMLLDFRFRSPFSPLMSTRGPH